MARKIMRRGAEANDATKRGILDKLTEAYEQAELYLQDGHEWELSERFLDALEGMSRASTSASTGFTNIITSLAIKSARPDLDIRNHQVQIGAPFSFRNISETVVYPWLISNRFEGAKSGWQTRTFERPKPYTMGFDENITAIIKVPFLTCYDEVEEQGQDAFEGLTYLVSRQIQIREGKKADLAAFARDYSELNNIAHIIHLFNNHFSHKYKSKGASRLPVLSIYAIYSVMVEQVGRYSGKTLLPLQSHSAADERTGAVGDIEVAREDETIFEALEIKHNIAVTELLIDECARKVEGLEYKVDRYYILTTHPDCRPTKRMYERMQEIEERTGCQIVVNGVLPTMQYYLRLLTEPSLVFPVYLELLTDEPAIGHEHRVTWNMILTGEV